VADPGFAKGRTMASVEREPITGLGQSPWWAVEAESLLSNFHTHKMVYLVWQPVAGLVYIKIWRVIYTKYRTKRRATN